MFQVKLILEEDVVIPTALFIVGTQLIDPRVPEFAKHSLADCSITDL